MKNEHENKDAANLPREDKQTMNSAQLRAQRKPGVIKLGQQEFEALPTFEVTPFGRATGFKFKRLITSPRGDRWMHGEVTDGGVVWDELQVLA